MTFRRLRLNELFSLLAVVAVLHSAPSRGAALASYVPPSGAISGWKMAGAARSYTPATLYDLIDGDADAVKQYGFVGAVDARYVPGGKGIKSIDINLYDMGDSLDAFGLFSQDRQGGKPITLGAGGSRTSDGTGISFWKGRYLVRIASTARTSQFLNAMLSFGRWMASRLPGSSALPALFRALPTGQQAQSEKYVRSNVEARAFLKNAVTARYPSLGPTAELFIAQYPSAAGAKAAFDSYQTLEKRNKSLAPLKGVGSAAFAVLDIFQRNVVVADKGPYVVGVVKANNMPGAQRLVRAAVARLH